MQNLLSHCMLCPRRCGVNRMAGMRGVCGAGRMVRIARAMLHTWEEPCLTGTHGAGAVFFSHCALRCIYCQNHEISHGGHGTTYTEEGLAALFLRLQAQGAATLDLVTPTHYVPQILSALAAARAKGLTLPVVYNTSGYETPETIRLLTGAVDIYLPDLKYAAKESGRLYSGAPDYADVARAAIISMAEQVGPVLCTGWTAPARRTHSASCPARAPPREHRHPPLDLEYLWECRTAQPHAPVYAAVPCSTAPSAPPPSDDL